MPLPSHSREWYLDLESWSAPEDIVRTETKDPVENASEGNAASIALLKREADSMEINQRAILTGTYDRLQRSIAKRGFPSAESVSNLCSFDEYDVWSSKGSSTASNKHVPAGRRILISDMMSAAEDVLKSVAARLYIADTTGERRSGSVTLALGKPASLRFYRCTIAAIADLSVS